MTSRLTHFCSDPSKTRFCSLGDDIKKQLITTSYYCITNNIGNIDLAHKIIQYICDNNILYKRGYKGRFGLITLNKSLYLMSSDTNCFQSKMLHSVPKWDKPLIKIVKSLRPSQLIPITIGPRLSLTFRFLGQTQPKTYDYKYSKNIHKIWSDNGISLKVVQDIGYEFNSIYKIVEKDLRPDVTKFMGKTYLNGGRKVVTYTMNDDLLSYKYGGKTVIVHKMKIPIHNILDRVQKISGVLYNWVHIVYYPSGDSKLDWHSDNEPGIAKSSTIAGISLFKNAYDMRSVEFK